MLNKKSIKVLSMVLLVAMLLVTVLGTVSCAVAVPTPSDVQPTGGITDTVGTVLGIIRWAGIAIAVGVAMFVGIKYITASPDGKAEVKKTLILYIGGIVLLLSASAVVTFIQDNIKA